MKLVLLHPLPLDGSMWPDDLGRLADDCLAPDLYALGSSLQEWAPAVLDLAGDGPVALVGCSVGGSCAIEIALLAPGKVTALVLSGTNAGHDPEPARRDEALRLLDEEGIEAAWDRYWKPLFGPTVAPSVLRAARGMATARGAPAVANGVRAFHDRPGRDGFLDEWLGPVWVVAGTHDIRPDRARAAASRLRRGHARYVSGAGHYVPLEAPEPFAGIVTEALRSTG